jgi:hypothetical protein
MFTDSVWFARIKELIPGEIRDFDYDKPESIIPGFLLGGLIPGIPGPFGNILGGVVGAITGGVLDTLAEVDELEDQLTAIRYLYSLEPTPETRSAETSGTTRSPCPARNSGWRVSAWTTGRSTTRPKPAS